MRQNTVKRTNAAKNLGRQVHGWEGTKEKTKTRKKSGDLLWDCRQITIL